MDISGRTFSEGINSVPERSRGALLSKANSPFLPTPPSTKLVRRKSSFVRQVDSSEESPSPHASIYEAYYFSNSNSDDSGNRAEPWPTVGPREASPLVVVIGHDENSRTREECAHDYAVDDVQFRYGKGTILETITEQKSNGTMCSISRPKSVDDMHSSPFLSHRDSFILAKSPRRKHSFSLDDLTLISRSYHEACTIIERTERKPIPVHEIYAQPKVPMQDPIERPQTPPGMPSWTESQSHPTRPNPQASFHQPGVQNCFQRLFGIEPPGITRPSGVPSLSVRGRSASAPVRGPVAPRFRPPRSAYGPIAQHPFNNAPVAKLCGPSQTQPTVAASTIDSVNSHINTRLAGPISRRKPGQKVRFTPSATARDSEMLNLRVAIELTSASALHPMLPLQSMVPMLPVPQPNSVCAMQKLCPHRKNKKSVNALNRKRTKALSNEDTACPSGDASHQNVPTCQPRHLPPTRPSFKVSSTSGLIPFESLLPSPTNSGCNTTLGQNSSNVGSFGIIDMEPFRTNSASSTTHLMPSTPSTPTPPDAEYDPPLSNINSECLQIANSPPHSNRNNVPCWRCIVNIWSKKVDQWWERSTSCLCFVCCGFECDEDMSLGHGPGGASGVFGGYGGSYWETVSSYGTQDMVSSRRVILEGNPAVMF